LIEILIIPGKNQYFDNADIKHKQGFKLILEVFELYEDYIS